MKIHVDIILSAHEINLKEPQIYNCAYISLLFHTLLVQIVR